MTHSQTFHVHQPRCHGDRLSRILLPLFLIAQAGLLGACSKQAASTERPRGGAGGGRPVPVTAIVAERKNVPVEIRTFGIAQAHAVVQIQAQVTEVLTAAHFQKGQTLKKGDPLFTLNTRGFDIALRQAEANKARDQAQAVLAEKDAQREADLLRKGISAQFDYDKLKAAAEAMTAALAADQAAIDNARLQREHCTILSPIDGRAGDLLAYVGSLVTANVTPLVTIHQLQPIDVMFSVPQSELPTIRRYLAQGKIVVRAAPPGQPNGPLSRDGAEDGELTFIDNTIDKTSGTIRLGAVFANAAERLWPGLYVEVCVELTVQQRAVVVPSQCVQTGRDGKYVFVIGPDKTVQIRDVVVDRQRGEEVVIGSGLEGGETVVSDGQLRLTPGAKAEIKPPGTGPSSRPASGRRPE